jgi:hypothetical protein
MKSIGGRRWTKKLFQPHPLYGYIFSRMNEAVDWVAAQTGPQTIGRDGFREVPNQGGPRRPKLTLYGCSFTFGVGISDDETFAARLQARFPDLRVSNKGISGYSNVQNLLHFRSDLRARRVNYAVLGFNSKHVLRNLVTHPDRMTPGQLGRWRTTGVEHMPRAQMTRSGDVYIDYVPLDQPALARSDFDAFLPDDYMIDTLTVELLKHFVATGREAGVPVLIALLEQREPEYNARVLSEIPEAVDVSVPSDRKYTLKSDTHPNAYANRIYAKKLAPHIERLTSISHEAAAG